MTRSGLMIFSFLLVIIIMSFVSAADLFGTDISRGSEMLVEILQDMFRPILYVLFGSSGLLFEKFLFLTLLIVIISVILKQVPFLKDNRGARIITALAVSFLATRFLAETLWAQAILLPYDVLGIALLSIIPFIIFFFFIEQGIDSAFVRKAAWSLYAVIFIGLWWSRYDEIGRRAWIFFAGAVLAIIVMLLDNTIQGYFVRKAVMEGLDIGRIKEMVTLKKEREELMELLGHATGDQRRKLIKRIADIENTIKVLSKRPY